MSFHPPLMLKLVSLKNEHFNLILKDMFFSVRYLYCLHQTNVVYSYKMVCPNVNKSTRLWTNIYKFNILSYGVIPKDVKVFKLIERNLNLYKSLIKWKDGGAYKTLRQFLCFHFVTNSLLLRKIGNVGVVLEDLSLSFTHT